MTEPDGHELDRRLCPPVVWGVTDRFTLVKLLRGAGVTGRPCIHIRQRIELTGVIEPCLVCQPVTE